MQSLPSECVPEVGTEGDNYRRKQCFLQIPLYDFSLDACHNMTDLEKKRYGKLTDRTREKFFGVGKLKLQNTMDKKVYTTYTFTRIYLYILKEAVCGKLNTPPTFGCISVTYVLHLALYIQRHSL